MKKVFAPFSVMLLCLSVALFGVASGAGASMVNGHSQLVICAGAEAVTITVDSKGNLVPPGQQNAFCCDCTACTEPTSLWLGASDQLHAAPSGFWAMAPLAQHQTILPKFIDHPQARAPPPANQLQGVRTVPGCGLVFKDATA